MSWRNTGLYKSTPAMKIHSIQQTSADKLYQLALVYWKALFKIPPFIPALNWQFSGGMSVERGDITQRERWKMFTITSCPSIHLFIREILSAMVCLSLLLPNLHFPFGEAISGRTVCLSCQLPCLRISTPEHPLVLGLHASDAILIFILHICALAMERRYCVTHISKLSVCH